jgi:vacuolar-type H+-ATPase subunit I/STV1
MSRVEMIRCTVVCRERDADPLLEALQDAALLHVAKADIPPALAEQLEDEADRQWAGDVATLAHYDRLARRRKGLLSVAPAPARLQATSESYEAVNHRVDALLDERAQLERELAGVKARIDLLRPWGEIDPADLEVLHRAGICTRFCRLTPEEWDKAERRLTADAPEGVAWRLVGDHARWAHVLFVFRGEAGDAVPYDDEPLPGEPLSVLDAERSAVEARLRAVQRELGTYAHFVPTMQARMDALEDRVALLRARQKGLHVASLFAVEGYVPAHDLVDFERALEPFDVAFQLTPVEDDDDRAPVKLQNRWLVRGFEAIVRAFSGISYHEKDYTWAAGLLFIVFGALCLLDAGYGLLLFATGLALKARGADAFGRVFLITGAASVGVGVLAGQYFGLVVGTHVVPGARPLLTLAESPYDAFLFSLVVGMLSIAFSYTVAIWQRGPATHATGGLLLVFAAMAAVFGNMAAGYVLTVLGGWQPPAPSVLASAQTAGNVAAAVFGVLALVTYVLFPDPVFGRKARVGNVLWTLYAGPTGFLQDLLSHMRLFGIALSGSIMALVVNTISEQFPTAVTVLCAIAGHLVVYLLALLSLYIHANRLIFLEFGSKCIDGGHNFYAPLGRKAAA